MPIKRGKEQNGKDWRSLQENWRYQGKISYKDGHNKAQEAEAFKNSREEYADKLCTKGLHDPVKHNGVIAHLEPDVLECEVKWDFKSITTNKALGGNGIQLSCFKF